MRTRRDATADARFGDRIRNATPGGIGWERCKDAWNQAVDDIQCPEGATPCQDSSTPRTARGKVGAGM